MNLKSRLQEQAQKTNAKWETIEKDYVLSWILEGISNVHELKETLVFKGGTALKKMYFGDYRFSEDLDFTVREDGVSPEKLEDLIRAVCERTSHKIQSLGDNVEFKSDLYIEKIPHPEGQRAFVIQCRLPWHRDFHTKAYIEVTYNEVLILPPLERKIIHPYNENLSGTLYVYALEEILAEKIRALLQFAKKLHERGWGRSRVRDYYDLWKILKTYAATLKLDILPSLVLKKCDFKKVPFEGIDDIFQEKLMLNLENEWDSWLSDIVVELPKKDIVIEELKALLRPLF